MVFKKDINRVFELIFKKYDESNKCKHNYETWEYTTVTGSEKVIEIERIKQRPAFQRQVQKIVDDYKQKGLDNKIWRVDVPDLDWIKDAQLYRTRNGSTLAIRPDGDIVAVAGMLDDDGHSIDNSEALLQFAVTQGGRKLDSFDGNWRFYRKCGFEPVTWIGFDEEYAPDGWVKGRDLPEPVIFMKYTGKQKKLSPSEVTKEMSEFYDNTSPSSMDNVRPDEESPWDVAYRERDELL